jgi:hypothetical protein
MTHTIWPTHGHYVNCHNLPAIKTTPTCAILIASKMYFMGRVADGGLPLQLLKERKSWVDEVTIPTTPRTCALLATHRRVALLLKLNYLRALLACAQPSIVQKTSSASHPHWVLGTTRVSTGGQHVMVPRHALAAFSMWQVTYGVRSGLQLVVTSATL